jgi:AcrR family transcriptional regulator
MAADTRERILEAACDLIASDGIDEVRIARVAMRAGASSALVHHYFSTREELLEEALRHSFETAGSERFNAEVDESASARLRLAGAIEACLPLPGSQERDWVLWVELWLRAARDPELRPLAADLYERYREWFAGIISGGLETGEFRSEKTAAEIADLAVALVDGLGIRAVIRDPQTTIERARELVASRLAEDLGVKPQELNIGAGS